MVSICLLLNISIQHHHFDCIYSTLSFERIRMKVSELAKIRWRVSVEAEMKIQVSLLSLILFFPES